MAGRFRACYSQSFEARACRPPVTRLNPMSPEAAERRAPAPEKLKILQGCRDMAIERLEALFATILDKVGDMLAARGDAPESAEEGQLNREARTVLARERANLLVEFDKCLRGRIEERLNAKSTKADFSKLDAGELTL